MKATMYKQFLTVAFPALTLATPQIPDLASLPQCAQGNVRSQITASSCATDFACVCRDSSFIRNLRNLIVAQCGDADADAADIFYRTTCAASCVFIDAASASTTSMIELGSTGPNATVTYTSLVPSDTVAAGNSTVSSITGNPSMTATSIPSIDAEGSCSVTVTTICHTATIVPTMTIQTPADFTGVAGVMGVSGSLAFLAVAAAFW